MVPPPCGGTEIPAFAGMTKGVQKRREADRAPLPIGQELGHDDAQEVLSEHFVALGVGV